MTLVQSGCIVCEDVGRPATATTCTLARERQRADARHARKEEEESGALAFQNNAADVARVAYSSISSVHGRIPPAVWPRCLHKVREPPTAIFGSEDGPRSLVACSAHREAQKDLDRFPSVVFRRCKCTSRSRLQAGFQRRLRCGHAPCPLGLAKSISQCRTFGPFKTPGHPLGSSPAVSRGRRGPSTPVLARLRMTINALSRRAEPYRRRQHLSLHSRPFYVPARCVPSPPPYTPLSALLWSH